MDAYASHHHGVKSTCGPFTVSRSRSNAYWVVTGPVPADVARKLYAHPVGRKDVRAGGNAGRISPDEWLAKHPYTATVDVYHVDTEEGWLLFNATLRDHGLV